MEIIWQGIRLDDKACDIKQQLPFLVKGKRHFWSILLKEEKKAPSSNSNLELMESFIKGKKGSTITWRKMRNL